MGIVTTPPVSATPDAVKSWIDWLPPRAQGYARLARLDRPAGTWLLFWPCIAGLALAGGLQGAPLLVLWLGLGSLAMRGAGCVWNDIVDRDLDAKVERTRDRPVASGRISVNAALAFAVALSLVGLIVLLQLRGLAQIVALASLIPVAAYPFMKRITWWPQAWLGMVFNWGLLVGWTQLRLDNWDALAAVYAGCICWVIGYDTIYALQDREDDAMVGIRSSALAMGARVKAGIAGFYAAAAVLWGLGVWVYRPDPIALLALLPVAGHLAWQVATLDADDPMNPLARFRSNRWTGALMAAACYVVGNAGA
jgi:4-hydroxybenzoate polyprenyltransferase